MTERRRIPMTNRAPVSIDEAEWHVIAQACRAGTEITARKHGDGRRLIYGKTDGGGHAGYLLSGEDPDGALLDAIMKVATILQASWLGQECIASLDAEEI